MEDMDKTTKTQQEQVECRACLQKFEYDAGLLDIFQPWDPPWDGMGDSIAQDMAQVTNIDITPTDEFSKLICQFCYQKLLEACSFIMNVRINDRLLRKRVETLHDHETIWPKPIQVNRNINSDVFNTSMDVPSKQDESPDDKSYANGADEGFKEGVEGLDGTDTYSNLGIKIEPEEIMQPPPIQITVNGTITQDQFEQNSIVMDGDHKPLKLEPESEPTPEICFANGAKEKKATKEEILRKKREAERKRYEKIKNDPQKREELREKERHQYRKKKEKGTRKLVGNMTPREHRDAKKKWKEHCTKYRNKKKV